MRRVRERKERQKRSTGRRKGEEREEEVDGSRGV